MSEILPLLRAIADPEKIPQMAKYHKTDREVLGVSNPQINDTVKTWRAERAIDDWLAEADALWTSGIFEARIAAPKLLIKARLPDHDAAVWEMVLKWLPDMDGWAITDHVADAGHRRIMADLSRLDTVETWRGSEHLWTKRAALVFTLPLAKLNHLSPAQQAGRARVLGWAAEMATDPEWFIQKAIAWWLRTLSGHDAEAVRTFLAAYGSALKPFAQRDAARLLPNP